MSKVIIFYSKAGGGHESAAKAIKLGMNEKKPELEIILIDLLGHYPKWIQKWFQLSYVILTEKLPWIWALFSVLVRYKLFNTILYQIFQLSFKREITAAIQKFEPSLILSTYYFAADISNKYLRSQQSTIVAVTIVTDIFMAPKIWFTNHNSEYLVFSDVAFEIAKKCGASEINIHRFGFLINPKFNQKMPLLQVEKFRETQEFSNEKLTILLIGGGGGFPNATVLLQKILEANFEIQILMVCGRNQSLFREASSIIAQTKSQSQVRLFGFTDKVYEMINASNLAITKAGPGMVLETLSQQKPCFLAHYIWEQEQGNVKFVTDNGAGLYQPNPDKMVKEINKCLTSPNYLESFRTKAEQLQITSDIDNISQYLISRIT